MLTTVNIKVIFSLISVEKHNITCLLMMFWLDSSSLAVSGSELMPSICATQSATSFNKCSSGFLHTMRIYKITNANIQCLKCNQISTFKFFNVILPGVLKKNHQRISELLNGMTAPGIISHSRLTVFF